MSKLRSGPSIDHFTRLTLVTTLVLTVLGAPGGRSASAAPMKRYAAAARGDFVIFGNTMGHDCRIGTPAPVVGTVGDCGTNNIFDSAPDVLWRADEPAAGQAAANSSITNATARTAAVLKLPQGAKVFYARLYWAATMGPPVPGTDSTATLARPGVFTKSITPQSTSTQNVPNRSYQRSAEVTADVQQYGAGAYQVSFADIANLVDAGLPAGFAGWYIVVFYRLDTLPLRDMVLYDGLDVTSATTPVNFTLDGFLAPASTTGSRLGVVAFEGDNVTASDSLAVNGVKLTDAQNPADNFFNSSRSILGVAESNAGDLPQLTGTAGSMSGMDLDIVDISDKLKAGDTSIMISATGSADGAFPGAFVAAVNTRRPDFGSSFDKTVRNVSRSDGTFRRGDQIEYTLTAANQGSDGAVKATLTDTLAAGLTLVPGSLEIVSGPSAGKKTDALGDDQAEYESGTRTLTFRIGQGASATQGGKLATTDPAVVVRFLVTINQDASDTIPNQGTIASQGEYAASTNNLLFSTWNSGNGTTRATPTVINVTALPPKSSDIALTFTSARVVMGVRYTATVQNRGPDAAPQVRFTYQLPANSGLQDLDAGVGWSCIQTDTALTCVRAEPLAVDSAPPVAFSVQPLAEQLEIPYQAAAQGVDEEGQPVTDPELGNNAVSGITTELFIFNLSGGGFSCTAATARNERTHLPLAVAAVALLMLGLSMRRRRRA